MTYGAIAMDTPLTKVDPFTFEILSHKLHQVTKEMGATLERVGGTVNTTQQKDYMAAIYRANGDVLSAGDTYPEHAACAGFAVRRIIERFEREGGIYPDDIFLLNDPYLAAIHQSDVYAICPIHFAGKLVGWSATFVHVMDIGAMSPGGNSPGATEIFHEGVRMPGLKLVERGRLRRDVFDAITNMTRQPVMVGLDMKCEIAANNVAKVRMQELCAQYGLELIEAVFSDMIHYSEAVLKKRIAELPDGVWSGSTTIEAERTLTVRLKLRKQGESLLFDFTDTDPQSRKGINLPYHATFGGCFASLLHAMGYDLPKNQGTFSALKVIAPEGTLVNVRYPGPVSMNTTSGMFIVLYLSSSVLSHMLAASDRWRNEIVARSAGARTARHAGINQYGRYYVTGIGSEGALGGSGARSYMDGVTSGGMAIRAPNVEWVEQNFPVRFVFRKNLMDSAGAGKFRGGVGTQTVWALHDAPEGKIRGVAMGLAGLRNSGQGIFGGFPAAPCRLMLIENSRLAELTAAGKCPEGVADLGGHQRVLPYTEFEIKANDLLSTRTISGGGYGDPIERDPVKVWHDVIDGYVSTAAAREVYGVLFKNGDEPELDRAATDKLRAELKRRRIEEEAPEPRAS
jgi:N-methylhydantoinase B